MDSHANKTHICPWWLGYFLISPIRKFIHDPHSLLVPYIKEGMTVLEIGPGMGFFSLPLARLVGKKGKVVCVDVQEKMLRQLNRRGTKAGLQDRIVTVLASEDSLRLAPFEGSVDFTLAFAVVHEIPDQNRLLEETYRAMKPGSRLLVSEPKGHVTEDAFNKTIAIALAKGFKVETPVDIRQSISMIFGK